MSRRDFRKYRDKYPICGYENEWWGTRGKSGKDPLRWLRLKDLETDHLEAILATQHQIRGTQMEDAVRYVLFTRKGKQNVIEPKG